MRYIFLDIDGVLNSHKWFDSERFKQETDGMTNEYIALVAHWTHLDYQSISVMNELANRLPDARIILSSTWRIKYNNTEMHNFLEPRGATFKLSGSTPRIFPKRMSSIVERGDEIQEFIDSLPEKPEGIVIIDDNSDMRHLKKYLVQTKVALGLTMADVDEAIKVINRKFE